MQSCRLFAILRLRRSDQLEYDSGPQEFVTLSYSGDIFASTGKVESFLKPERETEILIDNPQLDY